MKERGFTLIELLVVIAVIAVLMAILMPSLRLARDQAKRIHCIANIKTLSLAWFMYKDANDDELVPGHTDPGNWVDRPQGTTIEDKKQAIRRGLLYPYTEETVDVYRCPADQRQKDPVQFAFRSFSIAGGANGENWGSYKKAVKYSDLKRPAQRYIFVEEIDPRGGNVGSWQMNPGRAPTWVDPLSMWHNKKSTLGFADGHGEMHQWVDKSFIDWNLKAMYEGPSFTFNMSPPADEREDIEYMSAGFPYKSLN